MNPASDRIAVAVQKAVKCCLKVRCAENRSSIINRILYVIRVGNLPPNPVQRVPLRLCVVRCKGVLFCRNRVRKRLNAEIRCQPCNKSRFTGLFGFLSVSPILRDFQLEVFAVSDSGISRNDHVPLFRRSGNRDSCLVQIKCAIALSFPLSVGVSNSCASTRVAHKLCCVNACYRKSRRQCDISNSGLFRLDFLAQYRVGDDLRVSVFVFRIKRAVVRPQTSGIKRNAIFIVGENANLKPL